MPAWFDERFPPLSIYHGGRDYLVLVDPLLERLKEKEKAVTVIRTKRIEQSEHCDFYWAADAVEWLFEDLVGEFVLNRWHCKLDDRTDATYASAEDIEKTRPRAEGEPPYQPQSQRHSQANGYAHSSASVTLVDV